MKLRRDFHMKFEEEGEIEKQKFIIYKHISPSGKVYIGQTVNYNKRCTPGNYKSSPYFYQAIKKYGQENFEHIILKECFSQEEANEAEKFFIDLYNSTNVKYGYNIAEGGAFQRAFKGENNPFYGKHHTEETKIKLSELHKHIRTKRVYCINTGEIFESARIAAEQCGITKQGIQRCCSGGRPTAGKHPITKEKLKQRYVEDEI